MTGMKGQKKRFWSDEEKRSICRQTCAPGVSVGLCQVVEARLRSATFRKRLRALSKRLEIEPHLTPHRFRHSAATLLIEEGIDIRMVQALLGHANLRSTEIYVKVSNNALRSALERADVLDTLDQ